MLPYKVREDVDAIGMEFKMPLSRHEILCSPAFGFQAHLTGDGEVKIKMRT